MRVLSPQRPDAYSDPELVSLAKEKDAGAFVALSERYMPILLKRAGRYSKVAGVDVEDFIQEGMLALFRAVKSYDGCSGTRFSTYAITCINNSMTSAIKNHMKSIPKDWGVRVDDMDQTGLTQQAVRRPGHPSVEDILIDRETSALWARRIKTLLSDFERDVLKLYLDGQPYRQIAEALNTTTKAVDNALQRIRGKLRPK